MDKSEIVKMYNYYTDMYCRYKDDLNDYRTAVEYEEKRDELVRHHPEIEEFKELPF